MTLGSDVHSDESGFRLQQSAVMSHHCEYVRVRLGAIEGTRGAQDALVVNLEVGVGVGDL